MLSVLLEYIDLYTQGECSIRVYRSNIRLLCWHYASIMELPIMPKITLAYIIGASLAMSPIIPCVGLSDSLPH